MHSLRTIKKIWGQNAMYNMNPYVQHQDNKNNTGQMLRIGL